MGFKRLEKAARVVQRAVYGDDQRQIAQLGTAVNDALRKDLSPLFSIDAGTLILAYP